MPKTYEQLERDYDRVVAEVGNLKRQMKDINLASINAFVAVRRIVDESADALNPDPKKGE